MASRLMMGAATLSRVFACPASVRRAMAAVLFARLLAVPELVSARTSSGAVAGTVTDASGGLLARVTVTARAVATGFLRSVTTGPQGAYRLSELPPVTYRIPAFVLPILPAFDKTLEAPQPAIAHNVYGKLTSSLSPTQYLSVSVLGGRSRQDLAGTGGAVAADAGYRSRPSIR